MIILPQHRSDNRSALPHFGAVARPPPGVQVGGSPPLRAGATTALNSADGASPHRATRRSASGKGSRESPRVAGRAASATGLGRSHRSGDLDSQRRMPRSPSRHVLPRGSRRVLFQLRRSLQPCSGILSRFAPRLNELKSRAWSSKTEHMPWRGRPGCLARAAVPGDPLFSGDRVPSPPLEDGRSDQGNAANSTSRPKPATAWFRYRSSAAATTGSPTRSGGILPGLRVVWLAHSLMSGSAVKAWAARFHNICMRAKLVVVSGKHDAGHTRFFSSSSSRVAST